jgi:Leucine-rich repeat (LRR) protein
MNNTNNLTNKIASINTSTQQIINQESCENCLPKINDLKESVNQLAQEVLNLKKEKEKLSKINQELKVELSEKEEKLPENLKRKIFKYRLEEWINEATSDYMKDHHQKAAHIIQKVYDHKETSLVLTNLSLRTIPSIIGDLTQLTELDISKNRPFHNEFNALPNTICNLKNLKTLRIKNASLTTLPPDIYKLEMLEELDLQKNKFTVVPEGIFELKKLRVLNLGFNNIREIPDTFKNLINLTSLNLNWLELKTFPISICNLEALETLYLTNNLFTEIPADISKLKNLKKLDLKENKLAEFPKSVCDLEELKDLILNGNKLTNVPSDISKLRHLKKLDLSSNKFAEFPESICDLKRLKSLILNGNNLTNVPSEISKLMHLKKLDLSSNGFAELPESICNLTKLTVLILDRNSFTSLPDTIGNLIELNKLNLGMNELTGLPSSFGNLSKLEKLFLDGNELQTLPESFVKLIKLKVLHLHRNTLTTLPHELKNFIYLKELSLEQNKLTTLPDEIGDLSNLKRLHTESNELTELPNSVGNLKALKDLRLEFNYLTRLPDTFGNLNSLETLKLFGNDNLKILPFSLTRCLRLNEISLRNIDNEYQFDTYDSDEEEEHEDKIYILSEQAEYIMEILNERRAGNDLLRLTDRWKDPYKEYHGRLPGILPFEIPRNRPVEFDPFTYSFQTLLLQHSQEERAEIIEWTYHLHGSKDFLQKKEPLSMVVCGILSTMRHSKEFKEAFFARLKTHLGDSGDRAGMLLNIIYTDWKLHTIPEGITNIEKINNLKTIAKTETYRRVFQKMITGYESAHGKLQENQITYLHLYHEGLYKQEFGLVSAVETPRDNQIEIDPSIIDKESLKIQIEEKYFDRLAGYKALEDLLETHVQYGNEYMLQKNIILSEAESDDTENATENAIDATITESPARQRERQRKERETKRQLDELKKSFVDRILYS